LEKVQKRAVNMVKSLGAMSYEQKLAELKMETLSERRADADLTLMYKVHSGHSTVQ
jgi:hypothetical protein